LQCSKTLTDEANQVFSEIRKERRKAMRETKQRRTIAWKVAIGRLSHWESESTEEPGFFNQDDPTMDQPLELRKCAAKACTSVRPFVIDAMIRRTIRSLDYDGKVLLQVPDKIVEEIWIKLSEEELDVLRSEGKKVIEE
jgi:hypothetical protein